MSSEYYDSELTAEQIEQALNAIHGVIAPANNGKVLAVENGAIVAKSVSEWGQGGYPEPTGTIQITENGTVNVKDYAEANVNVSGGGGGAVVQPLSVTQNGTYNPPSGVDGFSPVTVNVSGGAQSNIQFAGDAYFGDYEGTTTTNLSCTIHGAIGAYAVLVVMHRGDITLPSGWVLVDHRVNPKTSETGNINQELSIYKKQMVAAQETVVISQASSVRICAASYIFGSDVNINYFQTLEMDDYQFYRYTVNHQNFPILFCMSNPYAGSASVTLSPSNIAVGKNGAFYNLNGVTVRFLASIINSPIDSTFLFTTNSSEPDRSINRAFLFSIT